MSTFKVGDWVRNIKYTNCVFKIKSFDKAVSTTEYDSANGYYGDESRGAMLEDLKPWTPQPGEWCWFWTNGGKVLPGILRVVHDGRYFYDSPFINTTHEVVGFDRYGAQYCEPFIGQLPSWVKE